MWGSPPSQQQQIHFTVGHAGLLSELMGHCRFSETPDGARKLITSWQFTLRLIIKHKPGSPVISLICRRLSGLLCVHLTLEVHSSLAEKHGSRGSFLCSTLIELLPFLLLPDSLDYLVTVAQENIC